MVEAGRLKVYKALEVAGVGSFLRGWRMELDPDGSLDVSFLEFCKACHKLRLNDIDATLLFGRDSPNEMTLDELDPESGNFVHRFRHWMTDKFGGPSEMFAVLEPAGDGNDGRLDRNEFVTGCLEHGFDAPEHQISEIFNLLDGAGCGSLSMEDVMFLDLDPKTREGAIQKIKRRALVDHEQLLTNMHREIKSKGHPAGHRLAPRGWHAPQIEKLPEVVIERRHEWKERHFTRRSETYAMFNRHIMKTYGNGIRAWRKGLDPNSTFACTRGNLQQYCRKLNMEFDSAILWNILDRDGDGVLRMEEVVPQAGAALARFWKWARDTWGTCKAGWVPIMQASRPPTSWKSITSLKYGTFLAATKSLGWSAADEPGVGQSLCLALDRDGCGIISKADTTWLDGWNAPEWLTCTPDKEAWLALSRRLLQKYDLPLNAWRQMDQDDSNSASWNEFEHVCDEVNFRGNRGGAWRYLDRDVSGTITMQEWHQESADVLAAFKEFMDVSFGSVKLAFQRIDTDNSGSVTFSELKRACSRRGFKGDVKIIFKCLNVCIQPGVRSLSYRDVAFLDTWEPAIDEAILDHRVGHGHNSSTKSDPSRRGKVAGSAKQALVAPKACKEPRVPERSASTPNLRPISAASIATPEPALAAPAASAAPAATTPNEGGGNGGSEGRHGSGPLLLPLPPRPSTPGEGSARSLTLSELAADLASPTASKAGRGAWAAPRAGSVGVAGGPQRKIGVGAMRNETVESMKVQLEKLRGAHQSMQKEHSKFRAKAQQLSTPMPRKVCSRGANRGADRCASRGENRGGELVFDDVDDAGVDDGLLRMLLPRNYYDDDDDCGIYDDDDGGDDDDDDDEGLSRTLPPKAAGEGESH